ncbi:MAG: DNA-directed RNA polymerase subunit A', partial [Candidatus Micrarchaeota archaeon]
MSPSVSCLSTTHPGVRASRISIMCHHVRVMPGRSFRINLPVCPPYNADFDGDEMNLHVPQTEEARVEAEVLMKVSNQIVSPRHGHAIIKPQEDHVSGAYFLTTDSAVFSREDACQMMSVIGRTELPKPDVKGGKFSGKLMFSQLLPKGLNVSLKSKLGQKIVIKDGLLLEGSIESRAYENDIIEGIFKQFGPEAARDFIDLSTRLSLYAISKHGFSVDLTNYTVPKEAAEKITKIDEGAKKEVDELAMQYRAKTLQRLPGRTLKETLEERSMTVLSKARSACGEVIEKHLGLENTAILMAKIGARGSILNAIQMAGMVGQQAVRGKRISRGYRGRTLIHYRPGDLGADARGFVLSPFRKGLTPTEFFFHSMGGRESLVNTAIRTARSGYMQRRLINALQDLVAQKDTTVRDSRGVVVEFTYGGDGVDPMKGIHKSEEVSDPERE